MGKPWIRVLAVGTVSLSIVGCGGSGDTSQVQQTVTKVLHALGSGDGATVCSMATRAGQAALANAGHSSCQRVVGLVSDHLTPAQKAGLQSAKVGKVKIDGSHATVPASAITSSKGSLKGFLQSDSAPTQLTKQSDGTWKLSG
ncbi:MAG TPA: hypothetical protein VGH45_11495 [Solirubrobacteraceae bacterium]